MKRLFLALVGVAALTGTAVAADLSSPNAAALLQGAGCCPGV